MSHCSIPDAWTGEEALAFVALLDRLSQAIWRAHGEEMARCLERLHGGQNVTDAEEELVAYEPIPFPRR
jgi:hypothetical protein